MKAISHGSSSRPWYAFGFVEESLRLTQMGSGIYYRPLNRTESSTFCCSRQNVASNRQKGLSRYMEGASVDIYITSGQICFKMLQDVKVVRKIDFQLIT